MLRIGIAILRSMNTTDKDFLSSEREKKGVNQSDIVIESLIAIVNHGTAHVAHDREQAISHTKALLTSFTCRYDNIVDSITTPLSFSAGYGIYGI
jgi:hypothetical protein